MRAGYDFSKGKRGALIPQKGKTRISIYIDNAVLDAFRSRAEKAGTGYQTMMNDALRQYLGEIDRPVTEKRLRQTRTHKQRVLARCLCAGYAHHVGRLTEAPPLRQRGRLADATCLGCSRLAS